MLLEPSISQEKHLAHPSIIKVVDGFFDDPHSVRALALQQSYRGPPPLDPNNPQLGGAAWRTVCPDPAARIAQEKIERILGKKFADSAIEFRYTLQASHKRAVCHLDGFDYTAIIYLTVPEHCQGGTAFFRHRATGRIRGEPQERYPYADAAEWEEVYRVPMQFNRLILYPGRLFHSPCAPFFGEDIANGRLTQNLFINLA